MHLPRPPRWVAEQSSCHKAELIQRTNSQAEGGSVNSCTKTQREK